MAPRLSIIPAGAVTDSALEARDLQVLCLLGRHTNNLGWCTRSQVKMADELSCSRSSVQRSLDRLYDAGWLQKKLRGSAANEGGQPSASYAYRVILDRDEEAIAQALHQKHGQTGDESDEMEGGCPPVGTPADNNSVSGGAQPDGHPGAQPYMGTGAQPYMGTSNDPLERPPIKRERNTRARVDLETFIAQFTERWPTSAGDSQQRISYAAEALTADERKTALANIEPFLKFLKSIKRTTVPAGFTYLEEKRWTKLATERTSQEPSSFVLLSPGTLEFKAVLNACALAGATRPFALSDGRINYRGEVTPQLLALCRAPPRDEWITLSDDNQIGAWRRFVKTYVSTARPPFCPSEGARENPVVPWLWPPRKDGSLCEDNETSEGGDEHAA